MIGGRSALLGAAGGLDYGNWEGNYSDVSLLLRGGVPVLVPADESPTPKAITAVGNASATTAIAKWNQGSGGSSLAFDGNGDYALVNSQMNSFEFSADFTIEGWFWFNTNNIGYQGLFGSAVSSDATGFALITETNNTLNFYGASTNSWNTIVASAQVPATGAWHHIAVCRSGSTVRLFYNGSQIGLATSSNFIRSGSSLRIGGYQSFPGGERSFNGYIDDLRITKGIARYTSNFTPPTAELPANVTDDPSYNSVSLLLRGGVPVLVPADESPTPKAITAVGNAGISTTTFKYGGSALAFDGNGDALMLTAGSVWNFSGGPHTIECWIWLNAYPSGAECRVIRAGENNVSSSFVFLSFTAGSGVPFAGRPFSGSAGIIHSSTIPLNQWTHYALVLNGASTRMFVNGLGVTASVTMPTSTSGNALVIGYDTVGGVNAQLNGLIDDLRITRNFARYTKNFLPPPAQLPAI